MATEIEITKLLKVMRAFYAHANFQDWEATRKGYVMMLSDMPIEILDAAVKQCVSTCEFFPTIAALRRAAAEIQIGESAYPPAAQAWGEFLYLALHYGHDHKPQINNPLMDKAIDALGWYELCMSENQVADRARFIEVYNQYLDRERREMVKLPEVKAVENRVIAAMRGMVQRLTEKVGGNGR